MKNLTETDREILASHMVNYANTHGLWPTIDFIVARWVSKNPEYFATVKGAITEDRNNLTNKYGTSEKTGMQFSRVAEVPEKIWVLIDKLFPIEKKEYAGGEKKFWRDFANRYPAFRLGIK